MMADCWITRVLEVSWYWIPNTQPLQAVLPDLIPLTLED